MLEAVKVRGKEVEVIETPEESVANNVIKRRFILETSKVAFPYFIFLLNFGIIAYSIWNPHEIRVVSAGIFFIFSIIFLKYARNLWSE